MPESTGYLVHIVVGKIANSPNVTTDWLVEHSGEELIDISSNQNSFTPYR